MNSKIKFLHVVQDDKKFFDTIISKFEEDNRLENRCVMLVKDEKDAFKSINPTERITPIWNKTQMENVFSKSDYDVLFLFSFCPHLWNILDYVPDNKIVIWWAWGCDLYDTSFLQTSQLIPVKLYKPLTNKIFRSQKGFMYQLKQILKQLIRPFFLEKKRNVLSRIDYFQPVILEDYLLVKKHHKELKASEFYFPNSTADFDEKKLDEKMPYGNILFGNSASYSNNHLDTWNLIKDYIDKSQQVIVPLNYGDKDYARIVSENLSGDNVNILQNFLDLNSYYTLLDSCSYFVCGVLRQQSVGNILYCIKKGIKIFLYKDSVVYNYLKNMGIVVYAIEDIDSESFITPLPSSIAVQNCRVYNQESIRRKNIYEDFILHFQDSM